MSDKAMSLPPSGRLELTWTNKHLRLLAQEDASYEWVHPSDYRVAEVRLLHNVATVGAVGPTSQRARENLLIGGDALHALTSLAELAEFRNHYRGQVRLVYIDPPFNTGQAFAHYDDGLEHSVWLSMLRDRLQQIHPLLSDDGSVWVHLDDAEAHRARSVLDEVFGADCFVATVVWRASDNSNNDAAGLSTDHNYIHVYSRKPGWRSNRLPPREEQVTHYKHPPPESDIEGPYFDGNPVNSPTYAETLRYDLVAPDGTVIPPPPKGWRWAQATMAAKISSGEVFFTEDNTGIRRRTFLNEHKGLPASALWHQLELTGHNRQAKGELKKLFPELSAVETFDTPKPEKLLHYILAIATQRGDLVLDCFLGSGTTAAVAQKMGRRWIGVEGSAETMATFALPRLSKVVSGSDAGGVTEVTEWNGGGGFRVLEVAPSMFDSDAGRVVLADWATNGALAEATCAQLGYQYDDDPPFCGFKGKKRLAVVDGMVNEGVVRLLVPALDGDERLLICGTALDPVAREVLQSLSLGSTMRKIPASLLDEYRSSRRSRLPELLERRETLADRVTVGKRSTEGDVS